MNIHASIHTHIYKFLHLLRQSSVVRYKEVLHSPWMWVRRPQEHYVIPVWLLKGIWGMRSPEAFRRETSCPGLWGYKQPLQHRKRRSHEGGFLPDFLTKGIVGQCLPFRKQKSFCILSRWGTTISETGKSVWHWTKESVAEAMTESGRGSWMCLLFLVKSLGRQKELLYGLLVSHLATWFRIKFFGYKLKFICGLTQEPG